MSHYSKLRSEYLALEPSLERLRCAMIEQLNHLVVSCGLTLGVPIEGRIKTWDSLVEKMERKGRVPKSLTEIDDLIGVRVIFLFQRDLQPFRSEVSRTFSVISEEDTSQRLADAQFGYKSEHYIVSMLSEWERIPSLKGLSERKVELQVRTLAQHIWAVASHRLQYKHEQGVPPPIRRTIYRVSALLETVDLEFTRVLELRDEYARTQAETPAKEDALDVAVVESVLDALLPKENKDEGIEDYSELLLDLQQFSIKSRAELQTLLTRHMSEILRADKDAAITRSMDEFDEEEPEGARETRSERLARGVYYTHVGLVREALCQEFGHHAVRDWLLSLQDGPSTIFGRAPST